MTDSFVEALAALSPSDGKRAASFLDKLLHSPDASGMRPEIVHDAGDRAIRSLKVSHDLRAIAHIEDGNVVLIYVSRHDQAYEWAKNRCIECHPVTGELQIVADPFDAQRILASEGVATAAARIASSMAPVAGLFDGQSDDYLLSIGVPRRWIPTIRMIHSEEMLLAIASDLPKPVAERLLQLATGELVAPVCVDESCAEKGSLTTESKSQYWVCTVTNGESLCQLLEDVGIEMLPDA